MDIMNIDSNDLEHLTQIFNDESERETLVKTAEEKINTDLNNNVMGNSNRINRTALKNKEKLTKKRKSNQITGNNPKVSAIDNDNNENADGNDMDLVEDTKAKPSKVNKRQKKMKDNASNNTGPIEETEKKNGKRKEKMNEIPISKKVEYTSSPKEKEITLSIEKENEKEKEKEKEKERENNSKQKSTNKAIIEITDKKKKKDKKEEKISKIKKGKEKEKEIEAFSAKKSELEEGDPKKNVFDYMITQNRPYSLINIFDNLHATIKKGQLQKILDSLADSGDLICKEYNSKIYLASQKYFPVVDEKVMNELEEAIESTKNTLTGLKETNSSYQNELKIIQMQFTDSELNNQIDLKKKQLGNLQAELRKWEEGKIEKISEEKMAEAEKTYNMNKNNLKKIKKICIDIVDLFCENMEMKRVDLMNLIGIETDTDIVLKLTNA